MRLFTIDNSFLNTPLKSELNMPFWVAPTGNNGTSEKVALFFYVGVENGGKTKYCPGSSPGSVYRHPRINQMLNQLTQPAGDQTG